MTKEIIEAVKEFDKIILHRHVRPDPDAYGSQAALAEIIKATFPKKQVYIVGEEDPSLHFLVRMDEIADSVYENALVIICDTANRERISDQRYALAKQIIKIDHHPDVDSYGDIEWIDTSASSTSEMIYEFYLEAKSEGFQMTTTAARLIYAGIVGDTGRFLFPSTTAKTFQYVSELVQYDIDRTEVYDGMYRTTERIARLKGYILQHFTLDESGMSTIRLSKDLLDSFQVSPLETGKVVGVLGEIEGLKAWVFFIEESADLIRVRLRSKGPIINEIAAKYNGGGHPLASGATVYSWEEADALIKDLKEVCMDYQV
ncbi:bifunctional oligoribonuclease/PAP phosphatase NrnA [Ornithinibacillus sp. 4-3]|uniref:Bifunctional oligoribonuclease/PAP phosphatase NrnA n=1 Tax=Ornithinibacillus sp. 4-3 TaxID=3231488 RepID=A0AB39HTS1_9BACI